MTKASIPRSLRHRVLAESGGQCAYCHSLVSITGVRPVIDHIIPLAAGGQTRFDNLCLACHSCNEFKAARVQARGPMATFPYTSLTVIALVKLSFLPPLSVVCRPNKICFDSNFLRTSLVSANSLLYEILTKAMDTYFRSSGEHYDLLEAVCREVIRQAATEVPTIDSDPAYGPCWTRRPGLCRCSGAPGRTGWAP